MNNKIIGGIPFYPDVVKKMSFDKFEDMHKELPHVKRQGEGFLAKCYKELTGKEPVKLENKPKTAPEIIAKIQAVTELEGLEKYRTDERKSVKAAIADKEKELQDSLM